MQTFVPANIVDDGPAVEIDQIIALQLDRGVDVILVRTLGVQLPAQEGVEGRVAAEIARAFPADVVKGADLQVPGVAHEGELEQLVEKLLGQHFLGGDDLGVARQLGGESVAAQVTEAAAQKHRPIPGVRPAQPLQRGAHAGAAGLGDMDEQKVVFD